MNFKFLSAHFSLISHVTKTLKRPQKFNFIIFLSKQRTFLLTLMKYDTRRISLKLVVTSFSPEGLLLRFACYSVQRGMQLTEIAVHISGRLIDEKIKSHKQRWLEIELWSRAAQCDDNFISSTNSARPRKSMALAFCYFAKANPASRLSLSMWSKIYCESVTLSRSFGWRMFNRMKFSMFMSKSLLPSESTHTGVCMKNFLTFFTGKFSHTATAHEACCFFQV